MEEVGSPCTDCNQSEKQAGVKKILPGAAKNYLEKSHDEEWYYSPNGACRLRYLFCGNCTYKSTSRVHLGNHGKKYHPTVTTALASQTPFKNKEAIKTAGSAVDVSISPSIPPGGAHMKKPTYESVKSRYKASLNGKPGRLPLKVATSPDEDKNNRELWYQAPNGHSLTRYRSCPYCNFKTINNYQLVHHVKRVHSSDGDDVDSLEPSKKSEIMATQEMESQKTVEVDGVKNSTIMEIPTVEVASSNFDVEEGVSASGDLQDRILELSYKKDVCELRLNFLHIDSIRWRLGDPETNQVDQSQLQLIEERIRSLKEHLDGLEVEL